MEYNPFSPEVQANPFPYYAYLRKHAPAYQIPNMGLWAVSRYDDVMKVLRTPQIFSSFGFFSFFMGDLDPFLPEAPPIIGVDPPDHTRLRKLVNRAFTPRRVASLERKVREVALRLLERISAHGEFDFVQNLSIPLPVIVIAELLGVPPERYPDFRRWTDSVVQATNGTIIAPEKRGEIRRNFDELFVYFRESIAAYRRQPVDNLISDLIRAEEENQTLTSEEVLSLAVFIIIAGSETTANLIANATLALCEHPEQMAKVRANPALIPNVVEETLRCEGSIQLIPRLSTQDCEIAGTTIPAGSPVMALLGSANHDERKFPDPDRFDITRNTEGHVGFGFGIHFCLGSQLARLETKTVLETLLERFPRFARKDNQPLERIGSIVVRGLKALPLVVG
ncbi:MAG: cytochrome P450 [Candidatus Binatia bacterium]